MAHFRLIPAQAKSPQDFRASTMNARTETVDKLWSFKRAWAQAQRCVIPAEAFYEPFYERADAKSERWAIQRSDGEMLAVAGLWDLWQRDQAPPLLSFTMLTINCDEHALLKRFHKWFDEDGNPEEKRTPVLLKHDQIEAWLNADAHEAAQFFRTLEEHELQAHAAPKPSRATSRPPSQASLGL